MESMSPIATLLKQFALFSELSEVTLEEIAHECEHLNVLENTLIIREGEYADAAYFIIEGSCVVYTYNKQGEEVNLATLHSGNYFGELALLTNSYRNAFAKAISPCRLLKLSTKAFKPFLENNISINKVLVKVLSERLVSVLHIVAGKERNIIILIHSIGEASPIAHHFLDYFNKISSKPIIIVEGAQALSDMEKKNNDIKNHYIFVKIPQQNIDNLLGKVDYIVDFINPVKQSEKSFYLPETATPWQIENVVRRICKKTVGIALCSGGVPGIAHAGVLKVLKRENIPIDFIVGTSMGSICGGCFAFDFSLDRALQIIRDQRMFSTMAIAFKNPSFDFTGIMTGKYYVNIFKQIFDNKNIEEAYIPLAIIASDAITGNTIVYKQGSVVSALRASCSVPILVSPIKQDEQLIIDGVATAPLPTSVLYDENIDIKIAVPIPQLDLQTSITQDAKVLSIYLRARSMMAEQMVLNSKELADVIIAPDVQGIKLFDWKVIDNVVAAGEEAAMNSITRIRYLLGNKASH